MAPDMHEPRCRGLICRWGRPGAAGRYQGKHHQAGAEPAAVSASRSCAWPTLTRWTSMR